MILEKKKKKKLNTLAGNMKFFSNGKQHERTMIVREQCKNRVKAQARAGWWIILNFL